MRAYLVSAFPERRPQAIAELNSAGFTDIEIVDPPVGRQVASTGLRPRRDWRDPFHNRFLTWGELSCFYGHLLAWQMIEEVGGGGWVFEDDVKNIGGQWFQGYEAPQCDLFYVGGKFMAEPTPKHDKSTIREAPYTYWTIGYHLTEKGARKCLDNFDRENVIPVDEYLPALAGTNPHITIETPDPLECWAADPWLVEPRGEPSGTESQDYAYDLTVLLFATDWDKSQKTRAAFEELGYTVITLGVGDPGWDTAGEGGIQKLKHFREALAGMDEDRIVLLSDGYDVLPAISPADCLKRFAELGGNVILSGERNCWPDGEYRQQIDALAAQSAFPEAPYKYPCSGLIIGFADSLRDALETPDSVGRGDDQRYWHHVYLNQNEEEAIELKANTRKVDSEGYLFLNLNGAKVERRRGMPYNAELDIVPGIIHGNNGVDMEPVKPLVSVNGVLAGDVGQWRQVGPDILWMPFMTPECCQQWSEAALKVDTWKPMENDHVPGDELRIGVFDAEMRDWMVEQLGAYLPQMVNIWWRPGEWSTPKDIFFIRHEPGRQPHIDLHSDHSRFSCSILLEKAEEGGELHFPRQNYSDVLCPVGSLICWPSRITHPHTVLPVTKGRRLSLVVWTQE